MRGLYPAVGPAAIPSHEARRENANAMDAAARTLTDSEIQELDRLLAQLAPPLDPLDVSALDGYLCGVLLQPDEIAEADWLPFVGDGEHGRAMPPGAAASRVSALVRRRHAELARAIASRQWFDPWVFELEGAAACAREAVQPWVAGFAAALDRFSGLLALDDPALIEPLAVIYAAFDPEDLLEAEDLLPTIDALEPPANMAEAVEDLVRSVLQIADVTRPRRPRAPPGPRRPAGQPT